MPSVVSPYHQSRSPIITKDWRALFAQANESDTYSKLIDHGWHSPLVLRPMGQIKQPMLRLVSQDRKHLAVWSRNEIRETFVLAHASLCDRTETIDLRMVCANQEHIRRVGTLVFSTDSVAGWKASFRHSSLSELTFEEKHWREVVFGGDEIEEEDVSYGVCVTCLLAYCAQSVIRNCLTPPPSRVQFPMTALCIMMWGAGCLIQNCHEQCTGMMATQSRLETN